MQICRCVVWSYYPKPGWRTLPAVLSPLPSPGMSQGCCCPPALPPLGVWWSEQGPGGSWGLSVAAQPQHWEQGQEAGVKPLPKIALIATGQGPSQASSPLTNTAAVSSLPREPALNSWCPLMAYMVLTKAPSQGFLAQLRSLGLAQDETLFWL